LPTAERTHLIGEIMSPTVDQEAIQVARDIMQVRYEGDEHEK